MAKQFHLPAARPLPDFTWLSEADRRAIAKAMRAYGQQAREDGWNAALRRMQDVCNAELEGQLTTCMHSKLKPAPDHSVLQRIAELEDNERQYKARLVGARQRSVELSAEVERWRKLAMVAADEAASWYDSDRGGPRSDLDIVNEIDSAIASESPESDARHK